LSICAQAPFRNPGTPVAGIKRQKRRGGKLSSSLKYPTLN